MKEFRWPVLAALFAVVLPAPAMAGPINWSYSSTGGQDGAFKLDPSAISFVTPVDQTQDIYLIGGVTFPFVSDPTSFQEDTLWTEVTIIDAVSRQSGMFPAPIQFVSVVPAPGGNGYFYAPQVGPIDTVNLVLGEHQYTVTNGPDRGLTVRVSDTPEPATLFMAGVGLAGVGLIRLRRPSPKTA
jgi:hypothetical protein